MVVSAKRIVETSPGVNYEYDLYEFEWSGIKYVARSYADEPEEAHFLRKEVDGRTAQLTEADVKSAVFREAVNYLSSTGKAVVRYLSSESGSYVVLPIKRGLPSA